MREEAGGVSPSRLFSDDFQPYFQTCRICQKTLQWSAAYSTSRHLLHQLLLLQQPVQGYLVGQRPAWWLSHCTDHGSGLEECPVDVLHI